MKINPPRRNSNREDPQTVSLEGTLQSLFWTPGTFPFSIRIKTCDLAIRTSQSNNRKSLALPFRDGRGKIRKPTELSWCHQSVMTWGGGVQAHLLDDICWLLCNHNYLRGGLHKNIQLRIARKIVIARGTIHIY